MMLGGSPVHRVWIITSTSEMSGNASSGMRRRAQIPASTSRSVPMKTRKRFRAHQSIHREITLHPSFGVHRELFGAEHLPAATHDDADVPGSPGLEDTIPLVNAFALVIQGAAHAHGRHAHLGHGWHEERNGHFCTRDGPPFASVNFTRNVLFPFRGGAGSVVNSIVVCGAFITLAAPAPRGRGSTDVRAGCGWVV